MKLPTFSVVTVTLNSDETLGQTLASVSGQRDVSVENIVKDGGSSDKTLSVAQAGGPLVKIIEQEDKGIYDAMNQGFSYASGEIICFLNSDDFFKDDTVLSDVAEVFEKENASIVYGDIDIVGRQGGLIRRWISGELESGRLEAPRQLPHPAFFVRRNVLAELGVPFDDSYRIAADFKQQLYLINQMNKKVVYLPKTLVVMRAGGASTRNFRTIWTGWRECMRAYYEVTGRSGVWFVAGKVSRKFIQLIR